MNELPELVFIHLVICYPYLNLRPWCEKAEFDSKIFCRKLLCKNTSPFIYLTTITLACVDILRWWLICGVDRESVKSSTFLHLLLCHSSSSSGVEIMGLYLVIVSCYWKVVIVKSRSVLYYCCSQKSYS
jgi:hypothetical protein